MVQDAQVVQRGLAGPVSGAFCCGQSGLVEGGGLVPVTADEQQIADGGGNLDGVQRPSVRGGVAGGGVQVGPLGFQPGGCLLMGAQAGAWAGGWLGGGRSWAGVQVGAWRLAARAVCR